MILILNSINYNNKLHFFLSIMENENIQAEAEKFEDDQEQDEELLNIQKRKSMPVVVIQEFV